VNGRDPSRLADRIRGMLGSSRPAAPPVPSAGRTAPIGTVAAALGGDWQEAGGSTYLVTERRYDPAGRHGGACVGRFADELADDASAARLCGHPGARAPYLFFDLETTGLSGGAGTLAFLVGCGWFDSAGAFRTRQYLLTRPSDERALLQAVSFELGRAGVLVSFNGRSFDAPVLETRYLFHRMRWVGEELPHLDVLHPARRFWRDEAGCSLVVLERQVLGAVRHGDVPGFEIPGRYFQFLRDGDARPLAPVLEHNRLDLLSLAGLTARIAGLARSGPAAARDAREALALGQLFARVGEPGRAREAFRRATETDADGIVLAGALRALALDARRRRAYDEAAGYWRRILDVPGCPAAGAREAAAAMAVHHEHRAGDLATARRFALRSLEYGELEGWSRAVRYRLARLERKLQREAGAPLLD
jgi:uncharacterized protein